MGVGTTVDVDIGVDPIEQHSPKSRADQFFVYERLQHGRPSPEKSVSDGTFPTTTTKDKENLHVQRSLASVPEFLSFIFSPILITLFVSNLSAAITATINNNNNNNDNTNNIIINNNNNV